MKVVFFDDFKLGAVTDAGIVDFSDLLQSMENFPPQLVINSVIEQWDRYRPAFEDRLGSGPVIATDTVRLRAPTPKPTSIVCMAVNYMESGTLKDKPAKQAFFKSSHSVIGPGDTMRLPDVPASIFEGEAELAVVIAKTATRVSVETAHDYIFGYMNFVDGSARGLAAGMGLPYFMKCQDDFAPLGPWLVTPDELDDPQNLNVRQWNNGTLTHDYNTNDMAHNIAESIAFVTANTTLEAGDVLALGVNHQGLHPLQDGDVVEQEIDGIGRLTFTVADPLQRTWDRQTRAQRRAAGEKGPTPQVSGKYA
ncbi:MAG: fumarylacetoacetate hydrolase family protein [Gammaproteobacteria bacterium]|nr:fumarylacetoacetate hydrolase family protein [Gammaproteobacteria bacterium]